MNILFLAGITVLEMLHHVRCALNDGTKTPKNKIYVQISVQRVMLL